MKVWNLRQTLIHTKSVGGTYDKSLGCKSNRSRLLDGMHHRIIRLTTIFRDQIEPTYSKEVHCHLLKGPLWNLGLLKHSGIDSTLANQSLGTPTFSLETNLWMEGLKLDGLTVE